VENRVISALIDTGFFLSVLDADDKRHATCAAALAAEPNPLLPEAILPELAYMTVRELGYPVMVRFLQSLAAGELTLVSSEPQDFARAAALMSRYADARVDYVDCMIFALAERLGVTRILTLDQRHFRLFRPRHCPAFELLP